jgi:hypothetical protein
MSKYDQLGDYLRGQNREAIPLTFRDISRIVGHRLPASSRYPAWWSNNETNNVMTKIWLEAGYKTEQVDISGEKLIFRRQHAVSSIADAKRDFRHSSTDGRHPIFGALKGLLRISVDLTQPADSEWGSQ